ncbi:predicted protein [Naegleria gruberi]|uniref:Predicted protein n=1 Tax=Naegleria gruberi TaxID=5762 RepID=D2W5M9_NAEGR|nr:uncharacterized protein NAEGRDRAFT_76720 [Naegleria gruberi]EFC35622.1 predicted protein [Naegleria gruberi]|eukprot:XP_002668366.1 predicted protein [Naegleria gruberi strain NEG-M]
MPFLFKNIRLIEYEYSNASDFDVVSKVVPNSFYTIPSHWDKYRNLKREAYWGQQQHVSSGFRIYDVESTIVDKVCLFNFLTSKGCEISGDVNEWLMNKLLEQVIAEKETEKLKAEIRKIQDRNIHVEVSNKPIITGTSSKQGSTEETNKPIRKDREKKQINVSSSFGLVCSNCEQNFVQPRKSRRSTKNLSQLTSQSRKANGERLYFGVDELLQSNGQTMNDFIDYLFERDSELIFRKLQERSQNSKDLNEIIMKISNKDLLSNYDATSSVYFTDKNLLSDGLYDEIVKFYNLQNIMISVNELADRRGEIDLEIIDRYKITSDSNGIHLDPGLVLNDALIMLENEDISIPEKLELKLFWDGRAGGEVVCCFVILNSELSTQCRNNVFITDMYKGKETKANVFCYFQKTMTYFNDLKTITYKSEKTGQSKDIPCTMYVCTDLSALWKISDIKRNFVCPYCPCVYDDRMEKDFAFAPPAHYFQKFPNLFTNVVIDILHAKLRIVGCLLSLQISKMTVSGIKSLEAKIQKLKGMSQFQFRKKQPATTLALQATNDKIELEVPYMNADQADMILLNYESIMMESLSDTQFNDNDFKVWSSLRFIIYHYLEASQGLLDLNFKKEELKEYLSFTKKVLREAFPNDQLAYYINIILYHLPDLLEKYGSLTKYMNQGCEAYHSLGRMIGQRKSNHKGKFNLPSFAESILLPTRTLYMSSKFKKKWHGLKTNPNMQISSEWQTTLATLKQDFEKLKSCSESLSDFSEEKKNSVYCHVQKNIWKKIVIENEPPEADESDSEGNKEDNNKIKKNNTVRRKIKKRIQTKLKERNVDLNGTEFRSSCDSCVKLKIRCNSGKPCIHCKRLNKECVYSTKQKCGRKKRIQQEANIEDDISLRKETRTSSSISESSPNSIIVSQDNPHSIGSFDNFLEEDDIWNLNSLPCNEEPIGQNDYDFMHDFFCEDLFMNSTQDN